MLGNLTNPLLVLPLQPASSPPVFTAEKNEPGRPKLSNLVGAGYQAFENSVLEKMKKVGNCTFFIFSISINYFLAVD